MKANLHIVAGGLLALLAANSAVAVDPGACYALGSIWWVRGMARYDAATWAFTGSEGSCVLTYPDEYSSAWWTYVVLLDGENVYVHEDGQPKSYYYIKPAEAVRIKHRTYGQPLEVATHGPVPYLDIDLKLTSLYASSVAAGGEVIARNVPFLTDPVHIGSGGLKLEDAKTVAESMDFRLDVQTSTYEDDWYVVQQSPAAGIPWPLGNDPEIRVWLAETVAYPMDRAPDANAIIPIDNTKNPQTHVVEIAALTRHNPPTAPSCNPDPHDQAPDRLLRWNHPKDCQVTVEAAALTSIVPVLAAVSKNAPTVELACRAHNTPRITFKADANTEYRIVVEGSRGTRGKMNVTVSWKELGPPQKQEQQGGLPPSGQ